MPVVYAMLRVLRESEYLRRPPGLKKFRGCYPARVISPVGRIPHAVSPGARVMMKSPVSTNPNERYRATALGGRRSTTGDREGAVGVEVSAAARRLAIVGG